MTRVSKLIDHCSWANASWIAFISDNCPAEESLLRRMSHILLGETAWFDRMAGKEPNRDLWTRMEIFQLRKVHAEHHAIYADLMNGDLERVIRYRRFTGEEYESPVEDLLCHLALHGTHHRGQMATDASAMGMKPINTDFVQFCLLHRI